MNGDLYKRINLTGSLSGAVRVRASAEGGSELDFTLGGLEPGMNVYTVSADRVVRTEYKSGGVVTPQSGVFAVAVEKEGRLVSAGFSGGSRSERNRILDELRIRAAGDCAEGRRAEAAPAPEKAVPAPAPVKNAPKSANADVTERILKQAERLFSSLGAEEEEPGPVPVANPFPKTYPDSEWRRIPGDNRLFGTVRANGQRLGLIALPADAGGANARRFTRGRAVLAADGKRYFIVRDNG